MSPTATPFTRFLGCDVGKDAIVVCDPAANRTFAIDNHPRALAAFAGSLDPSAFVVCEATGGYEAHLLAALLAAGVAVHRADARKVKAFIRSFGTLAKTDAIDARALARYATDRHAELAPWRERDPARLQLQALALTRRDLVRDRLAYANRRNAPTAATVVDCLDALLEAFDAQIKAVDHRIDALVASVDALARDLDALVRIKGLGRKTAATLIALMPELGALNRKNAAALAGLAPHPDQSGNRDGYRRTRGGRPVVRQALFMPALAAARYNPRLSAIYKRLIANGKKPLVALGAVMRNLLVIANATLKKLHAAQKLS